jgi:hypothetical protein
MKTRARDAGSKDPAYGTRPGPPYETIVDAAYETRPGPLGILRVLTTAAAVVIGGSSSVLACPVCFGAEETSMIDGTKLGILVMIAITAVVQAGFVGFFLYLRKRAKRIADVELDTEWSELQRASRTS